MTNMTFTKGIGTPVYMAPEMLKQNKYKKAADIFSFAITMYEVFAWEEAYPKKEFKFPWKIAEFVVNGERRKQTQNMSDEEYQLIQNCWNQNAKERLQIEQIVECLDQMLIIEKN